jgi:hypothetical protein
MESVRQLFVVEGAIPVFRLMGCRSRVGFGRAALAHMDPSRVQREFIRRVHIREENAPLNLLLARRRPLQRRELIRRR